MFQSPNKHVLCTEHCVSLHMNVYTFHYGWEQQQHKNNTQPLHLNGACSFAFASPRFACKAGLFQIYGWGYWSAPRDLKKAQWENAGKKENPQLPWNRWGNQWSTGFKQTKAQSAFCPPPQTNKGTVRFLPPPRALHINTQKVWSIEFLFHRDIKAYLTSDP